MDDAKHMLKLIVVGDHMVGKSSFLERASYQKFDGKSNPTIGLDFQVFMVNDTKVQAWDLSGHPRFRQITEEYFKENTVAILCYSGDVRLSKQHIFTDWLPTIKKKSKKESKCYIVKLKTDTETEDDTDDESEIEGIKHFKVSAKRNSGYDALFQTIVSENVDKRYYIGKRNVDFIQESPTCCTIN